MKKKIKTRIIERGKWTQMFATDFSFKFSCTWDLATRIEIREEQQEASHFEDFEAFSLVDSIFKYFSSLFIGDSSFLLIVPEVLF